MSGGESTLVDDLIALGYQNITVMDISHVAVEHTKKRLGPASDAVKWLVVDVIRAELPARSCDIWHDRAVFHFLTEPAQRLAYVRQEPHRSSAVAMSLWAHSGRMAPRSAVALTQCGTTPNRCTTSLDRASD
jgi:hypothetical protein